jgi:hypothetical protein
MHVQAVKENGANPWLYFTLFEAFKRDPGCPYHF